MFIERRMASFPKLHWSGIHTFRSAGAWGKTLLPTINIAHRWS